MAKNTFYAVCPLGTEELLAREIEACGGSDIKKGRSGLSFTGSMAVGMKACMHSRIASRILLRLGSSDYYDEEDIYNFACRTKWENHFGPSASIRVDVNAHRSPLHSLDFALLRIKDGICDRFMHFMNERPNVDRHDPQIRIFAYMDARYCTFYLDLCGEALFKRGWRADKGEAPLKENLAAALLMLSGWEPSMTLVDPFCGSGTIPIEAASIATNTAPGLNRHFLFENFSDFDRDLWDEIREDARAAVNRYAKVSIQASDISTIVVGKAVENARAAGFGPLLESGAMKFSQCDARRVTPPEGAEPGLLIANPPYGEQSNPKSASVASMMKDVSDNLKHGFAGWTAWLLTSDRQLPRQMRLSESRKIPLFNGPLECRFFKFDLVAGSFRADRSA